MVAGGAEAAVCELGIAGFCASRALSTGFNDRPPAASRPWDKDRDGFVMGEGAGVLVLEEYEHAKQRGAKIYAEIAGYGMSGDAYHITAPAEDHDGAFRAMKAALKQRRHRARPTSSTSTRTAPPRRWATIWNWRRWSGCSATRPQGLAMSSTKSATGHLLGAAGAVEAIFSILAIRDGVAPPTLNLDEPSRDSVIDRVAQDGAGAADQRGAVQQLRLRRHQRLASSSAPPPDADGCAALASDCCARLSVRRWLLLGGLAAVRWWLARRCSAPGPIPARMDHRDVVVPRGARAEVAASAAPAGVIDSEHGCSALAAWLTRAEGQLHAAEFAFPAHAACAGAGGAAHRAKPVQHHLTIPEGLTARADRRAGAARRGG